MFHAKLKSNDAPINVEFDELINAKFIPFYPHHINLLTDKLKQEQVVVRVGGGGTKSSIDEDALHHIHVFLNKVDTRKSLEIRTPQDIIISSLVEISGSTRTLGLVISRGCCH